MLVIVVLAIIRQVSRLGLSARRCGGYRAALPMQNADKAKRTASAACDGE
jgi:hypothetical protein